jgi:hypothetical protein
MKFSALFFGGAIETLCMWWSLSPSIQLLEFAVQYSPRWPF